MTPLAGLGSLNRAAREMAVIGMTVAVLVTQDAQIALLL
jgi:hypothetical protein